MKAVAPALLLVACVDSDPPDPPVTLTTQDMMTQPGETITVHGCPTGSIEFQDGGGMCYNPSLNLPGSQGSPHGPYGGGGFAQGGGGGGGGGRWSGGPIATSDPNVVLYFKTFGGTLCRSVCLILSAAVCVTITDACATATVVTIGGMALPCGALIRACIVGAPGVSQFCSDYVCPD